MAQGELVPQKKEKTRWMKKEEEEENFVWRGFHF